ncbi:DNA cross-link repair 1A protein [Marchantia polymorpha subsp. ruderalis]|uniref:SAM domain-containing protein n=2 Tax=Marchantia polymorpha TaxID=3197 RepID=A0AAF6ATU1_MARPO|nr:hypothetical protein MARPO_0061s0078 [Marchantia polymorpha]BBM99861.1 hypothetical protein Mp_1g24430 [Marchantia polymorpha subsp. ruderalis]|eukprot:PTQ36823.1 hypothetical protein MARPO_0061s0078 [Marchantia polymorpha]
MAGDTDLDLALAIALAEASEEYSDDDFKPSSRQLELRQGNLIAQCRKPTKSRPKPSKISKEKTQRTEACTSGAGAASRKKSHATKGREVVVNKRHKKAKLDVMNGIGHLQRSEGAGNGLNVQTRQHSVFQGSVEREQDNVFGSFKYKAAHFKCLDVQPSVHEVGEGNPPEKLEQVSQLGSTHAHRSSAEQSEDEDSIVTENIGSPVATQSDGHEVSQDVPGIFEDREFPADTIDSGASAPESMVSAHSVEQVTGLENESQFSALLRLCTEESPEREQGLNPTLAMKNCTVPGSSDLDDGEDDISYLMTQPCVNQPAKTESSSEEILVPFQDITNVPRGSESVTSDSLTAADSKHCSYSSVTKDQSAACTLSSSQVSNARGFQDVEWGTLAIYNHEEAPSPSRIWAAATRESDHTAQVETYRKFQVEDHEASTSGTDHLSVSVMCPICDEDLSHISFEEREKHTNTCLNKLNEPQELLEASKELHPMPRDPSISFGCEKVKQWLKALNLSRYLECFNQHEIDWDTLQWLTDEDLVVIGVACLGPRRKILGALQDLKSGETFKRPISTESPSSLAEDDTLKIEKACGKDNLNLITRFFPMMGTGSRKTSVTSVAKQNKVVGKDGRTSGKLSSRPRVSTRPNIKGLPAWMCIPGTPFRVDAFQHLTGDCSHWFLTHFHTDHYQGLTRGFRYGRIFCSEITARLVNARIGVSWERLMIVPLNEKFKICGVDVTFIDANHCPGSVMILFEPPNGEAVLHTGDFRFCSAMRDNASLQSTSVHTLILDTTYCDQQYDFPKQEAVIQFVIEAIQAELFNPETLFLIGTYTIGKERVFLEVGKVLQKKIYVGAAKMKLLECMDLSAEDLKWLTCNDQESFIHVVPLWSISSFKRMSSISRHYRGRYKLLVAFSPTGWSFGRGKKKTPGKRHQQGTMIRYDVPYSEHSSFCELKEFVKFIAPADIIPSVPGKSGTSADDMIASLWSEDN